jgi:hypothetical protein
MMAMCQSQVQVSTAIAVCTWASHGCQNSLVDMQRIIMPLLRAVTKLYMQHMFHH